MKVNYYSFNFGTVTKVEKQFYEKQTKELFKNNNVKENYKSSLRRLFDDLSELVLREGDLFEHKKYEQDGIEITKLPESTECLLEVNWPKADFDAVICEIRRVAIRWLDGITSDNEGVPQDKPMQLYRNICYLVLTTAYQLKLKGYKYRYIS